MDMFYLDCGAALWFGFLTAISPCPMTANIAAISFLSKNVKSPGTVLFNGLLYLLGGISGYVGLGIVLVSSTQLIPVVARFFQVYMNIILGPLLIAAALLLLELFKLPGINFSAGFTQKIQRFAEKTGALGAFILGLVFALAFCPVSAGFFFGSLIALAVRHQSYVFFPSLFAVGTALPVLVSAFILAFAANKIGTVFNKVSVFQKWARRLTAAVFLAVGIYYCWEYIVN